MLKSLCSPPNVYQLLWVGEELCPKEALTTAAAAAAVSDAEEEQSDLQSKQTYLQLPAWKQSNEKDNDLKIKAKATPHQDQVESPLTVKQTHI